jgi:hypothetical protein
MKTHLATDPRKGLGQEMRGSHPELDRSKWMLHGLDPNPSFAFLESGHWSVTLSAQLEAARSKAAE